MQLCIKCRIYGFETCNTSFTECICFLQLQHFFRSYGYLLELIFALLTFGHKCVRVLARPKGKSSLVCAEFSMGSKFHYSQWKTYFSQFMNKFSKLA